MLCRVSCHTPQGTCEDCQVQRHSQNILLKVDSVKQVKLRISQDCCEWEVLIGKCSSLIIQYFVF